MNTDTRHCTRPPRRTVRCLLAALLMTALAAACVHLPRPPASVITYDFGTGYPQQPIDFADASRKPLIALARIGAQGPLGTSLGMTYRLEYDNDTRIGTYTEARWSAPPAALVQQRLEQKLADSYAIISAGEASAIARNTDGLQAPIVRIQLEDFIQLFSTPEHSTGLVRMRVTLLGSTTPSVGASVLGQRLVAVQRPATSADAAGGVRALADATDAAAADIAAWVAQMLNAAATQPDTGSNPVH